MLADAAAMRQSDDEAQREYAAALGNAGVVHAKGARYADAARCFRRALNATPDDASLPRYPRITAWANSPVRYGSSEYASLLRPHIGSRMMLIIGA